jgi:hypothetical protein
MRKPVFRSLGLALLLATSGVAGACARCDNDGPAEEAMEDVGEAVDEAADDVEDAID